MCWLRRGVFRSKNCSSLHHSRRPRRLWHRLDDCSNHGHLISMVLAEAQCCQWYKLCGFGIGGVAFTWGTRSMIKTMGLSWALRATGLITLAANVIAILLIRDRNHHIRPTQLAFNITHFYVSIRLFCFCSGASSACLATSPYCSLSPISRSP